jgi:hypothetical protein
VPATQDRPLVRSGALTLGVEAVQQVQHRKVVGDNPAGREGSYPRSSASRSSISWIARFVSSSFASRW